MAKSNTVSTADGGTMTINGNGRGGFIITATRGFKETPEERKERIRTSRQKLFDAGLDERDFW